LAKLKFGMPIGYIHFQETKKIMFLFI